MPRIWSRLIGHSLINIPRRARSRWYGKLESLERRDAPAAFTAGNIVVVRDGTGSAAPGGAAPVFLEEFLPNQVAGLPQTTPVQSIALPSSSGTGPNFTIVGAATADGYLSLSPDGKFLAMAGYNVIASGTSPATQTSTVTPRAIAMVDSTGAYRITSFTDAYSSQNARAAVTVDGFSGWVVGSATNGVRYSAKPTDTTTVDVSSAVTAFRTINIFGGQLYITSTTGAGPRLATVGTGLPTTSGQSITSLSGYSLTAGTPNSFFFADLDANPGFDTLYVADETASTGGIQKYTLTAGTWTLNNTVVMPLCRSMTGYVSGGSVTLFATTGATSPTLNTVVKLTDSAGFGNNNNGTTQIIATVNPGPGTSKALFRGIALVPQNSLLPTTLNSLTASTTATSGPSMTYTATFADSVSVLSASNFQLDTTGTATGTIGTPTGGGTTWTIPINSISGGGTIRLKMVNSTSTDRQVMLLPTQGDLVTVSPPGATLDVTGNAASYAAALGKDNNITVTLSAGTYTVHDDTDPINLTAAAIAAGWSGSGSKTVTCLDTSVSSLSMNLGDGTDSFTLDGIADPLDVQTTGASATSSASIISSGTVTGAVSISGFASITAAGGVLLTADTVSLSGTAIGTSVVPINTKASSVIGVAGAGGMYFTEEDGASFNLTATSSGGVTVVNKTNALSITQKLSFASGDVNLSSGDGISINANIGDGTSSGTVTLVANADGAGAQGLTMAASASINTTSTASNAFSATVNTVGGGTGDATFGTVSIGITGTIAVDVNAGSIFSAGGTSVLSAGGGLDTLPGTVNLTTSGAASAIGTSSTRLLLGTGNVSATAGTGGIYITENTSQPVRFFKAIAQGTGAIDLFTATGSENGIVIAGPVTTGSGPITIKADDNLTVQTTGTIGGPSYSGKMALFANTDAANAQQFKQDATSNITVETTNNAADAIVIDVSGETVSGNSEPFSGALLGNIKVGAGGGITVNTGTGVVATRAGRIRMVDAISVLDTGATGTVILTGRDNPIGESARPINIIAGTVSAKTNSTLSTTNANQKAADIYITTAGAVNFSGSTTTATNGTTIDRRGSITFTSNGGDITLAGDVTTDNGDINLISANDIQQTSGKVATDANLVITTSGTTIHLTTAGNKAGTLTVNSGQTLRVDGALTVASPIVLNGTLSGGGTVSAVTAGSSGVVSPGASPGKLSSADISMVGGSQFVVELNGTAVGTGYDQLNVAGTVDLGNATLVASLGSGFTPPAGYVFKIIDNDASDDVTGTFNGLAEGDTVTIGGIDFTISYAGGSGNDVTLKAPGVAPPPPSVSSIQFGDGTAQRSMVKSVAITFSTPVTFTGAVGNAFTLFRHGSGSPTGNVGFTATQNIAGDVVTLSSFTGSLSEFGSLVDGYYDISIDATQVNGTGGSLDGPNDTIVGGNYVAVGNNANKFFRLYGDSDGNAIVDQTDFISFRSAFNGGASTIFDFEGDGNVTQADFIQFRARFNLTP